MKPLFTFSLLLNAIISILAAMPLVAETIPDQTANEKVISPNSISTWQRWEHLLISDKAYANPCSEIKLHVRFDGPDRQTRDALGFWDGDNRFIIRCAFPTPGEWRWSTTCSDASNPGLHAQSGSVKVNPPADTNDTNPLTKHGYPRVSDDRRLLVYADGTPLLWIGDTCWTAPVNATDDEWNQYVTSRAAKGYTVLQLSIAPDWALENPKLPTPPFLSKLPDITMPNPLFFQQMDRKLALANDHGLVIMLVGLMETPYRYPTSEQITVFSQYVAARYSSFATIFSPSFDSDIHQPETLAAVNAIRLAAPANLITMHMGTAVGPHFHSADWLSFDMYQSGHNNGNTALQSDLAINMPATILDLSPRKPIINGEAIYEGDIGGPDDVRRTAWLSFLSGAAGYTAGINDIYLWNNAIANMNPASTDHIALLARILKTLPWWQLNPEPKRILNQPPDHTNLMALAITENKSLAIAYLPANDALEIDLSQCPPTYNLLWIDPATGQSRDAPPITSSPKTTLLPPDKTDWLAILTSPDSQTITTLKTTLTPPP